MTEFTQALPGQQVTLAGTTEEGFETLYGVPVVALGQDDRLMALGHLTDRAALAVTTAYHRRVWGYRILPNRELARLTRSGTQRSHITVTKGGQDDDYPWQFEDADPDDPTAQTVTLITIEWLDHEDITTRSTCPACARASWSTSLTTGPGRAGWGRYHRCLYCGHRWPTAPAPHPSLTKNRRWNPARPDGCFACACLPHYPCTDGCAIGHDPLTGQQMCATCRSQHTDDIWKQMVAVAYGTATTFDYLDDQRDRWLYSEALRGIPPAQAARTWQQRLALASRQATPRSQPTAS
ncbi:hypothetical protein ACFZB4_42420 [Streptomyces pseudovenezuelae]|uniref:hypothetical protein n=1 Tax=Streptomyces pseudovenezuelae TaxID=67350 RepID=UPI0036E4B833